MLQTAEFLQRLATSINESPSCDSLLPALFQIRVNCLKTVSKGTGKVTGTCNPNLCCRWCLNSWSLGQYSVRLLPQKRPRGYKSLRAKFVSNIHKSGICGKQRHKFICHNFLSLKCDICLGVTKIPTLKPTRVLNEEKLPPLLLSTPSKKKKKSKKKDHFVGLSAAAVKAVKQKIGNFNSDDGKPVLNVFEVLSPSSIQNGVNIVSNRTNKTELQASVRGKTKSPIVIKDIEDPSSLKLSSVAKSKKKKTKTNRLEKLKSNKVASALASFLNSI